ncbi:MAG: hypothetical protein COA99_19295 [Moraxellaceae bacterium]|nr:MAG: hypothetical protein COA99_19295 [Moraxellaceae bacterium]
MDILGIFGLLLVTAIVVAFLFSSAEKARELKLVREGAIPAYTGYNEDEIRTLKADGYKTIAIKRIRLGYEEPKRCGLRKAMEVYDVL